MPKTHVALIHKYKICDCLAHVDLFKQCDYLSIQNTSGFI